MTVVNVTNNIKKKLLESNFSTRFLDNCLNSKFLSIELQDEAIVGVGFVGGMLNSYGVEIAEELRGKGIGKKLLSEIIDESKKRKFSYLTGVFKPSNTNSVKLHMNLGFVPLFTFYFNKTEGAEIPILVPFNKKGSFLISVSRIFNTKLGNLLFGFILSFLKPLLKNLIAFSNDEFPKLDLKYSTKNFEKINETLANNGIQK